MLYVIVLCHQVDSQKLTGPRSGGCGPHVVAFSANDWPANVSFPC